MSAASAPDGESVVLPRTTARELLGERLAKDREIVAVRAGGKIYDVHTPLDEACVSAGIEPVRANDPAGVAVIRHSSAHVMADAVQRLFPGTKVTIGPATQAGFYYDFDKPSGPFTDEDLAKIETAMLAIVEAASPFRRELVSREDAKALFAGLGETYKGEIIDGIPAGEAISLYRHGAAGSEWVDLCAGPHVPHTGMLKAIKLTSVAGAYWRGDERNPMLQRIYGTAFGSPGELRKHLALLEEAKKRDHRKLGKELELFMFHEYAPAMPFFLPRGAGIYTRLVRYIEKLYAEYGYEEVLTPQIFDKRLFETSGHLPNYRENMYLPVTAELLDSVKAELVPDGVETVPAEKVKQGLAALEKLAQKPMNCPSHCLIFNQRRRSYRELPWRVADFCRLHRYERGGVVHGLARVRSFSQDDAHIFCTPEQMQSEIQGFVRLLFEVYHAFNFERVDIKLATRPEQRIGTDAQWDAAETALAEALKATALSYEVAPGEGAFYGPKLEFHVLDALQRSWQLGTIQVDYALPDRFELEYTGPDGKAHRPVMLHRAILGSLERFMALFIEHTGGNFPVWVAPEQARVVTVSEGQDDYAEEVARTLRAAGLRVATDTAADKLGAKIRNARLMRVPYILVVGDKEVQTRTVAPRSRDLDKNLEPQPLETFLAQLVMEAREPRLSQS
ncbi:MAG: threonine--tRNA ligase [Myxococcales bacterium]|nr:threonine--tRNA ligase [Myxococcales bacterium]